MNKQILLLLLTCIALSAQELTLDEFITKVYSNSERLEIAKIEQLKGNEGIREAYGNLFPTIKLTGQYAYIPETAPMFAVSDQASFSQLLQQQAFVPSQADEFLAAMMDGLLGGLSNGTSNNSLALGFSINQTIWAGGRIRNAHQIAKKLSWGKICQAQQVRMEVKAEGTRLFYQGLLLDTLCSISEKSYERSKGNHELTRDLYNQLVRGELDTLQSYMAMAENSQTYENSFEQRNDIKRRLISMAGLECEPDSLHLIGSFSLDSFDMTREKMLEKTLDENKVITQLTNAVEIAELQLDIAKGSYYPTVVGGLNFQRIARFGDLADFSLEPDRNLFLGLEYELFSFNRRSAQVRKAELDVQAAKEQLDYQIREMTLALNSALDKVEQKKRALISSEVLVKTAQKAYKMAEGQYRSGVISQLAMNEQEEALLRSRLSYVQALFEHNSALIDLRLIVADYIYEREK